MQEYKFMVRTLCRTYNHSKYIVDALEGFCSQRTNFPVINIIVDDCSTDGEPDIIRNYFQENFILNEGITSLKENNEDYHFYYGKNKNNSNCYFAIYLLKYNHFKKKKFIAPYINNWNNVVKYYALCEGDDYWTDPNKLQKQVDFLESHPDYVLCTHAYSKLVEKDNKIEPYVRFKESFSFGIKEYLKLWPTQPLTAVYRSSAIPTDDEKKRHKLFRDNHLYYYILKHGKGYYLNEFMGVYRITQKGVWTSLDSLGQVEIDLKSYLELLQYNRKDCNLRKKCVMQYVQYVQSCKENNRLINNDIKKQLGILDLLSANILMRYSKILHLIGR